MPLFSLCVGTLLPESPTKLCLMTLKQRVTGTKINADIPVGFVLVVLDFFGSAQFVEWGQ